jgi:O-antigen ligase
MGMLPFFISHPWRILALVLLGVVYYLVICAGGALMYKLQGKLNRRALPGIFGFPIFLATWMPINIYACLTPPPRWKAVRHVRSIDRPDDGNGGDAGCR